MSKLRRNRNTNLLSLAVLLFAVAVITAPPARLQQSTKDMFAAVGVSMSVAQNPINTQAQQLKQKETQLDQREATLLAKENPAAQWQWIGQNANLSFYSLCMSTALFILVGINFYFDFRRKNRSGAAQKFSVDLR